MPRGAICVAPTRCYATIIDAAEGAHPGYSGPFTVPLAGPWTLAASVTDEWGERALRDAGYVAELSPGPCGGGGGVGRSGATGPPQG